MTWPRYQDVDVECWEHASKLGAVKRAFCLHRANTGSGHEILSGLNELDAANSPARLTLTLKQSARKKAITKLQFLLMLESDELAVMHIARDATTLTIEMTPLGLNIVRYAIQSWLSGSEDFGGSPTHSRHPKFFSQQPKKKLGARDKSSGELWFWGPSMEP